MFLPTTSPSPDFWGGMRPGDDGDADSVVALKAETGAVAWAFKTVHHDLWDYDNPAQPTLGMVTYKGRTRPAVLQPTKQGLLFTLDRETGKPLIPVEERPVPQGGAPGEALSPTQPFPIAPGAAGAQPHLAGRRLRHHAVGARRLQEGDRRRPAEGLFTPPSLQGTIIYPFTGGGTNWGGLAFDPARDVVYVNTSSAMHLVKLIPAAKVTATAAAEPEVEISPQAGRALRHEPAR